MRGSVDKTPRRRENFAKLTRSTLTPPRGITMRARTQARFCANKPATPQLARKKWRNLFSASLSHPRESGEEVATRCFFPRYFHQASFVRKYWLKRVFWWFELFDWFLKFSVSEIRVWEKFWLGRCKYTWMFIYKILI